jgi:hypothetical protein
MGEMHRLAQSNGRAVRKRPGNAAPAMLARPVRVPAGQAADTGVRLSALHAFDQS